ncbi:Xanthine phosphoribosyltransferase 1 [Linnemannia exigua]|uniref:Xanthine phosphoribosyltransferase 1 n=1 Tax=Linnemannia exigua TaxID=604196 RepID=A0AAD4DKW2_9FUNG|nr:Xanthine phosphoribosyltransferase 1 [Linnemannia exigua]
MDAYDDNEHDSMRDDDRSDKVTDGGGVAEIPIASKTTKEMDDGEEDPMYYPGEVKFMWEMPHWIPDWLTSKTLHPDALWTPPQQQQQQQQQQPTTTTDSDNKMNNNDDENDPSDSSNLVKRDDGNGDHAPQQEEQQQRDEQQQEKQGQDQGEELLIQYQKRPPTFDVVYTWVNGSDPEWQFSKTIYESKQPILTRIKAEKVESRTVGRYRDNDELRHSVRSAYKFGKNVIRKIHISTADVIEEGLWTLWQDKLKEEEEEERKRQEQEGKEMRKEEGVTREPQAESTQFFKRDRHDFDMWMEFAKTHSANRTTAVKGMEVDDKYIIADEEPPARPFVRRSVGSGEEVGQVPTWLDRSPVSREKIDVAHHSTFFKNKDNLPVYCSVAIESQLYRIPNLSEVFIYMNDDEYFGMEMAQSDFWTPHYGLVLQMNPANLVLPHPRDFTMVDPLNRGYLDNLYFTNYLLSKRFGFRYRPFLDHIVQVGSRSLLKETEALWPEAFLQTEKSHFRMDYDGNTVSTMFLMAHYTIERLRETQLRSFWRYRVDCNSNGDLEWAERWALVSLIEDWNTNGGGINRRRTGQEVDHSPQFLSGFRQVLEQTGYGDTQEEPATRYVFSGMEGYPFLIPNADTSKTIHNPNRSEARAMQRLNTDHSVMPADRTCTFDINFCLGPQFLERRGTLGKKNGERIFKRMAFDEFHCGDCLLQIALQSDRGVEYYLERMEEAEETDWDERVPFTSRHSTFASAGTDDNADDNSGNAEESENTESNESSEATGNNATQISDNEGSDNNDDSNSGDNNIPKRKRDHSTKETVLQRILSTKSSTTYTTHTRGIPAILPSPSHHPKARLRIIKDLYRYNFVMGESDSFFVTLIDLEKAQDHMAYLDKVKENDRKLHIVCLNDGIIEEKNGTEVRALLRNFLEDRYGDPAPWEKEVVGQL